MSQSTHALIPETPALTRTEASPATRERKRIVARWVRRGLLVVAALAVAGGAAFALRPRPVPVELAVAKVGPLEVVVEETGVARSHDHYVVSAPTAGTLSRIMLEVGDSVREGQTVAEMAPLAAPLLDPRARAEAEARLGAALSAEQQARAQVARASAARELADQELARTRQLKAGGAVTGQALDQAAFEARLRGEELRSATFGQKVATEEVRLARAVLGGGRGARRHVDVVAPVSGRVLRIQQKSAGVVQPGTPLLEIADPAALEVVVDLLTPDAVKVHPGTKVVVSGWGGEPLAGRVHRIEPAAFTRVSALGVDEQRVNVIVGLVDPRARWQALGDGFRIEARLLVAELDRALTLPLGAVFRGGGGWAVFRVDSEGRARAVPVEVGARAQALVEVRSGVVAGDKVVVHPGDKVRDGVRVAARP
jgi:HlyD family secretion protein